MEVKTLSLFLAIIFSCRSDGEAGFQQTQEAARVVAVQVSGDPGDYRFSVALSTPDLGCEQYADWWEVVSVSGELLYRRILTHSHVDEQPFTRFGGPVKIVAEEEVWVRVHMNNTGYASAAMYGSPSGGFQMREIGDEFAANLAQQAPLPNGCRF